MYALAGWLVWCSVAAMALQFWARMGIDFYTDRVPRYSDSFCALVSTMLCSWFLIVFDWDKLHMLWLALLPLSICAAASFSANPFRPRALRRRWARLAEARLQIDMTKRRWPTVFRAGELRQPIDDAELAPQEAVVAS